MESYSKQDSILIWGVQCSTTPVCSVLLSNEMIVNATPLKTYGTICAFLSSPPQMECNIPNENILLIWDIRVLANRNISPVYILQHLPLKVWSVGWHHQELVRNEKSHPRPAESVSAFYQDLRVTQSTLKFEKHIIFKYNLHNNPIS